MNTEPTGQAPNGASAGAEPADNGHGSSGQPDTTPARNTVDTVVFGISAGLIALFVVLGAAFPSGLATAAQTVLDGVITGAGWLLVLVATGFVVFVVWLAASPYGRVRLGRDDERPEFSTVSWIAMMFSAGMGIGLMFFGVAEPISHLAAPPQGDVKPESVAAAQQAMDYTLFHWTFHPWAIYAVVGLAMAYGAFRKGRDGLISSALTPVLGDRAQGKTGRVVDVLAIFATLFGSATSLGLGALQINGGFTEVFGAGSSTVLQIGIIAVLTVLFVTSAVSGVERGIKWLSNTNMVLAVGLLVFLVLVGPTIFILNLVPASVGSFVSHLVPMSMRTGAYGGQEWMSAWTLFYWAWWISWTPFVGAFIARISRGRTVREFLVGVIGVPSAVSVIWFAVFGGTAIRQQLTGESNVTKAVGESQEGALFAVLGQYPLATLTAVLVVVLVGIFFVSGADAASVVLGSLSSRGSHKPRRSIVVIWGVLTGAVAAVLLLAGGLTAVQTVTILAAAPFALVMILLCWALTRDLRTEKPALAAAKAARAATARSGRRPGSGAPAAGEDADLHADPTAETTAPTEGISPSRR